MIMISMFIMIIHSRSLAAGAGGGGGAAGGRLPERPLARPLSLYYYYYY